MSWNRLYRPHSFSELHLDRVRATFLQLLEKPRLPQAYLFAGPKGTGKTSASRILAAVLNDPRNEHMVEARLKGVTATAKKQSKLFEPDNSDDLVTRILSGRSLAVHELDAASNRGIDDVRLLKERVYMPPQEGLVSVFILDEAHMLTNEASNALLKVLEEPPTNVVFILATTERHKILPTIVSRCHTVEFSKATEVELQASLAHILDTEGISFEPEALLSIAKQADGSFRDAVKLLESICSTGSAVTASVVAEQLSGTELDSIILDLVRAVVAKQPTAVSTLCMQLRNQGLQDSVVNGALLRLLHAQLLASLGVTATQSEWSTAIIQFLLQEYSQPELSQQTAIALLPLELKSLELIARAQKKQGDSEPPKTKLPPTATLTRRLSEKPVSAAPVAVKTTQKSIEAQDEYQANGKTLCDRWGEFVELVATANATLGAFLRSAEPLNGSIGRVVIRVFYAFHKDQLLNSKSQIVLQDSILQLCGGTLELHIEVLQPLPQLSAEQMLANQSQQLPALAAATLM